MDLDDAPCRSARRRRRNGPPRSAALFHDGNVDATIAPLATSVSDEHPASYEPVTLQEHLRAKLAGSRNRVLNPAAQREVARLAPG